MATATSPYVPVGGDVVVEDGMTEDNIIIQSLHWIGFTQQNQRQNIINNSLGSFSDILMLREKDITAMATEWAGRTSQKGRITFGVRRESSHGGIYNSDGTIITGHIPNWRNLSHEERNLVKQERRKSTTNRDTRNDDGMKANANRIKQLQASNKKMKRKIKALKRSSKKGGEDNEDGESDELDAGDTFGGKASRRKKADS